MPPPIKIEAQTDEAMRQFRTVSAILG